MNLKQLLYHFKDQLKEIYDEQEIVSVFNILVEHISGLNRSRLMLEGKSEVNKETLSEYFGALDRLLLGEPVQYIIRETAFYGLRFKVNPSVLIPRPETEELVEWIIERCTNLADGLKILDIGTGSGCIAVSLKKNIRESNVNALDVSESALNTASENAALNHVDINFIKADILSYTNSEKYDIIVSNPPYITAREQKEMHQNVLQNEPHEALFVPDEKPLLFYEAIAEFAFTNLHKNGLLCFEINEHFGKETVDMLKDKSFNNIVLKKDMQGKNRMIIAVK